MADKQSSESLPFYFWFLTIILIPLANAAGLTLGVEANLTTPALLLIVFSNLYFAIRAVRHYILFSRDLLLMLAGILASTGVFSYISIVWLF